MSIIFIAGLPRSGTTFLQSQFLNFDKVVALGEVTQTIYAIKNIEKKSPTWKLLLKLRNKSYWNRKTYPILLERIRKDSFWSKIEDDIRSTNSIKEAIELVYSAAYTIYPNHLLIDSSKSINHLKISMESEKYKAKIFVIHCVRDYRGWIYSIKKHKKRLGYIKRSDLFEAYTWLKANKQILKLLKLNFHKQHLIVSYDKMIFNYSESMKKMAAILKLSARTENSPEQKFHEILGSQTFKENINTKDLMYDSEWFQYQSTCLETPVQRLNKAIYKMHLN